jgi:hypothetical protein
MAILCWAAKNSLGGTGGVINAVMKMSVPSELAGVAQLLVSGISICWCMEKTLSPAGANALVDSPFMPSLCVHNMDGSDQIKLCQLNLSQLCSIKLMDPQTEVRTSGLDIWTLAGLPFYSSFILWASSYCFPLT